MSDNCLKESYCPVVSRDFNKDYGDQGFLLENGKTLPALTIRYETYGNLNEAKTNAVWICSPLTADAHAAGRYSEEDKKAGWWDELIGPGKAIDTDRFFVVCSNILGGCKGTTGPASINPRTQKPYGSTFPTITIGDMVHAQKELANDLGIKEFFCVVGGSMGGFQAMKWAIYYPDQVKRIIVIASSPRFSSQALGFEVVARDIITQDPNFNNGDYYNQAGPHIGLANARKLAHITYLSAIGMEKKFKRAQDQENRNHAVTYSTPFDMELPIESYLRYQGTKFVDRFDANSYLHIAHATDTFDLETEYGTLEKAFQNIGAQVLNVNLSTDWLFPPHESRRITSALLNCGKSVTSLELDTQFGHDGFLIEVGELGKAVGRFLDSHIIPEKGGSTQSMPVFHDQSDFDRISKLIPDNSRVLDLGCGGGELLAHLAKTKNATGFGVEKNIKGILDCLENDVPVIQRNLDEGGIADIEKNSFDYAIINRTIQEIRDPVALLNEILRVAKRAIVTFPNFGHWSARGSLMLHGRMPKSKELPYEWYDTPNIRVLTLKDFYTLCEKEGLKIETLDIQNESTLSKIFTALGLKNFGAEHVIATISKR
ncbi:MAG: homoserine O-acetyltransferase [Fibrobacteraceae bacterium]|nr:homoserine O-acetyltransferase [Fibrobacteraceae bacterium]